MPHHQVPTDGRKNSALGSARPSDAEHLLRLLIKQLVPAKMSQPQFPDLSTAETDEIVLDVELDGHRYILVRSIKSSRAPIELSPREKEIVRMVAQGHPNKIIAGVLNISSWTVCTHLRRVFAKLGVSSRAAMVAKLHELLPFRSGKLPTNPVAGRFSNAPASSQSGGPNVSSKSTAIPGSHRQTA
jgi:DNA-binding CsgD family transcriptional regulator